MANKDFKVTSVFAIGGKLVVADSIEDAIRLYREYAGVNAPIRNVTAICADGGVKGDDYVAICDPYNVGYRVDENGNKVSSDTFDNFDL